MTSHKNNYPHIKCQVRVVSTRFEKHFVEIDEQTKNTLCDLYNVNVKTRKDSKGIDHHCISVSHGKYHHLLKQHIQKEDVQIKVKYDVYIRPYEWKFEENSGVACAIYYQKGIAEEQAISDEEASVEIVSS